MTTICFSKALAASLISHAGEGNTEAVRQLSVRLPAGYQNALQNASQERMIQVLQPGCVLHPIRDLMPEVLSYLTPKDCARASAVNSFFLGEISPVMLEALSKTTFFMREFSLPRPCKSLEAVGKIFLLNLKNRFLNAHPANPQTFSKIKDHVPQILSYLTLEETQKLALCNPFFKTESYSSLLSLTRKSHFTFENLTDLRDAFNMDKIVNVLTLNLSQARRITRLELSRVFSDEAETVKGVIERCPNLTNINLEDSYVFHRQESARALLTVLSRSCPNITRLKIGGGANSTISEFLPEFNSLFPHLQHISLKNAPIDEGNFIAFVQQCKKLKSIDVQGSGFTDKALEALGENNRGLENVNLAQNFSLSEEAVIAFIERCTHLTSIDLSHFSKSDAAVSALAKFRPNLKDVVLAECSPSAVTILALLHACPKLESVDVSHCTDITYDVVLAVFKRGLKVNLTGTNFEYTLDMLKQEFSYKPVTPLGKLYHAVLNRDLLASREFLNQIDKLHQDRILDRVRQLVGIGGQPLDDLSIFQEAMEMSIRSYIYSLTREESDRICLNTYYLAGSPKTNHTPVEWGWMCHPSILTRLADAYNFEAKQ